MPQLADNNLCNGCELCANVCKHKCITFEMDKYGFYYPVVDENKCINCHLCEKACPVLNESVSFREIEYNDTIAYGAYMKNQKSIKDSASGGIAYSLAEYTLLKKGIVYGVVYENNFRDVVYSRVSSIKDIDKMRGSKYVMARKNDIYNAVKKDLKLGTKVLFIGLPCEIGGLYAFLKRNYDNLLTVELICAGTGSYLAHRGFIDDLEKKERSKIRYFTYRRKIRGWVPCYVSASCDNNKTYTQQFSYSTVGSCIEKYKRKSCLHCLYKSKDRKADLTIGDFWTLNPLDPIYNHWGTSVVFPRTSKGVGVIESMDNIIKRKVDVNVALNSNRMQLTSNPVEPENREEIGQILFTSGICSIKPPCISIYQRMLQLIPGDVYKNIKKFGYWLKYRF